MSNPIRPLDVGDHIHIVDLHIPHWHRTVAQRCDETCYRVWSMLPDQRRVNLINHRGQMSTIGRGLAGVFRVERTERVS